MSNFFRSKLLSKGIIEDTPVYKPRPIDRILSMQVFYVRRKAELFRELSHVQKNHGR